MDSASTAAAFLALVALSDGLRLLPAGAIVVCRLAFADWAVAQVTDSEGDAKRLRLITWCSPVLLPVLLTRGGDAMYPMKRAMARCRARARRTRSYVAVLRVGGLVILLALVMGIPWLTARSGGWGLVLGVSILMWLCVMQSLIAVPAFRRAGVPWARALLRGARFLWPFSAPRAAEEVLQCVVADAPALVLLHDLLPAERFAHFARPMLFDAVTRRSQSTDIAALRSYLGEARIVDIVRQPPVTTDGDVYCPRCGASFYKGTRYCSDCVDVELLPQQAA